MSANSLLQPLSAQALLGTDRSPSSSWHSGDAAVDALIAAIASQAAGAEHEGAVRMLRSAGALAICARAGYEPIRSDAPLAPACAAERRDAAPGGDFGVLLAQIFSDAPQRLRREALAMLDACQRLVPPRLLPQLLEAARQTPDLREPLASVMGERGRWLAQQNPRWNLFATDSSGTLDIQAWEDGRLEQRVAYLTQLRSQDADRARTLLAENLGSMAAAERAALLDTLATGLSPRDEDFIDQLRSDRSKEVRQIAKSLLVRLPASRYVTRMTERLAGCLTTRRTLLMRTTLAIEPPETFMPDWKDDGIEEVKPQNEKLGQRAWWLFQIARTVPLSWWQTRTGLAPDALLDWARRTDWEAPLLCAWLEVLQRERDPLWAHALLTRAQDTRAASPAPDIDPFALVDMLEPRLREEHWRAWLAGTRQETPTHSFSALLDRIQTSLPPHYPGFPVQFGRVVIEHAHAWATRALVVHDYAFRRALIDLACLLPPELFDEALRNWPRDPQGFPCCDGPMTQFSITLAQRKQLHQLLK
jgi:hypothetical protein